MSKPTKVQVVAALQELGVEVNPEAKYDDLVKQLDELKAAEETPRIKPTPDAEEEVTSKPVEPPKLRSESAPSPVAEEEDYLRKYQYRKQTVPGSKGSDPSPGSKAALMKAQLLKQPKIRTVIHRERGEDPKNTHTVNLNGYRLDFPKNVCLDVPEQVSDVLMEQLNQTNAALDHNKISGDEAALT